MVMSVEQFAAFMDTVVDEVDNDPMEEEKRDMAQEVREIQIENFAGEADEQGIPWQPRTREYPHEILRETFAMHDAATTEGSGSIERIEADGSLTTGIDGSVVPYAAIQNDGSDGGKIPARQYYFIRKNDMPRLHDLIMKGPRRVVSRHLANHSS